jgi:NAD(P)H-dependent FMN reductase
MITIISGTNREDNNSIKISRHLAGLYGELGEAVELLDLRKLPAEAFLPGIYSAKPESLTSAFTNKVLAADGLVVVVPEYNGSFPGILKHFIDLLPFPESFNCRPVAFIGLAAGYNGALRAVEQLQMVFAYRNAHLFNRRVFIPAVHKVLGADGSIADEDLKTRLQDQATHFIKYVQSVKAVE